MLADLERYRGGRILALGEGLAAERVTGAFGLSDPDAALETIAATLGVSLTRMPLLAVVRRAMTAIRNDFKAVPVRSGPVPFVTTVEGNCSTGGARWRDGYTGGRGW